MNFNQRVWELTKQIPKGKITTYKQLAIKLNTKAYRAVGHALNKNRSKDVPCHRVIQSNGKIGGFAWGPLKKTQLLTQEGIVIKNNKINIDKYLHKFQ